MWKRDERCLSLFLSVVKRLQDRLELTPNVVITKVACQYSYSRFKGIGRKIRECYQPDYFVPPTNIQGYQQTCMVSDVVF